MEYKYHTVTLDTVGQASSNIFTCYLTQPIRNIVEAKLIAAHIKTTEVTEHCVTSQSRNWIPTSWSVPQMCMKVKRV